jgi:hypothetical protein
VAALIASHDGVTAVTDDTNKRLYDPFNIPTPSPPHLGEEVRHNKSAPPRLALDRKGGNELCFVIVVVFRWQGRTTTRTGGSKKNMRALNIRNLRLCLVAAMILTIPLIIWSFPRNPPLGKTGAPGESTCAACHFGGLGGGKIAIASSSGTTYSPGVTQHLTVTISDPNAIDWGYEMTAVKTSTPSTGEGMFTAVDNNSDVRSSGTKSYASQINDKQGKTLKVKYLIDWTPPNTNVGKITLYVAGIGGTGSRDADSVYTRHLTLTPQ